MSSKPIKANIRQEFPSKVCHGWIVSPIPWQMACQARVSLARRHCHESRHTVNNRCAENHMVGAATNLSRPSKAAWHEVIILEQETIGPAVTTSTVHSIRMKSKIYWSYQIVSHIRPLASLLSPYLLKLSWEKEITINVKKIDGFQIPCQKIHGFGPFEKQHLKLLASRKTGDCMFVNPFKCLRKQLIGASRHNPKKRFILTYIVHKFIFPHFHCCEKIN